VILTPTAQEAILKTFEDPNEWLSHALAGRCGLRSGEVRASWLRGCEAAGAPRIPLYEGTKHSGATDMLARTKDRAAVRDYLGHTDARSTDKYAKVTSGALVDIAKRRQ
jgi:integrase